MQLTEAQKRAKAAYRAKCKSINIQLFPADADIIEKLETVPVKTEYIKQLIRADIEKNSNENLSPHTDINNTID